MREDVCRLVMSFVFYRQVAPEGGHCSQIRPRHLAKKGHRPLLFKIAFLTSWPWARGAVRRFYSPDNVLPNKGK